MHWIMFSFEDLFQLADNALAAHKLCGASTIIPHEKGKRLFCIIAVKSFFSNYTQHKICSKSAEVAFEYFMPFLDVFQ